MLTLSEMINHYTVRGYVMVTDHEFKSGDRVQTKYSKAPGMVERVVHNSRFDHTEVIVKNEDGTYSYGPYYLFEKVGK